jgi:hypothetical protein
VTGVPWADLIPDHEVLEVLKVKEGAGARVVLRTRFRGRDAVTRVVGTCAAIPRQYGPIVRALSVQGRGATAGLPEDAILVLEGYRSAARLHTVPGIPEVLDAGVLAVGALDPRIALLPAGAGWLYVTTRWMDGQALDAVWSRLTGAERDAALRSILERLCDVHAAGVVYADLKPGNVILGPDGEVSLIDLDTIREVGDERAPAATVDLTRHYAAPEQQRDRVSFLPSDLYAFGVMAARLVGGGVPCDAAVPRDIPAPWDRVVAACLRAEPFQRPRARDVLAALREPGAPLPAWDGSPAAEDATERVPDAAGGATERVPEPPEDRDTDSSEPDGEPTAAPSPWRRRRRWAGIVLAIGTILGCTGLVGRVAWDMHERTGAQTAASLALADLRAYKTDPVKNLDGRMLEGIVTRAQAARRRADTPYTRGVYALAWIWSTEWHHKSGGRSFNQAKQSEGDAITAIGTHPTSEALFARGMYEGAICVHRTTADAERQRACDDALRRLDGALGLLRPDPDDDWIRVEVLWAAEMVQRKIATRMWEAGDRAGARAEGSRILQRCAVAEPLLGAAPVNGVELAEDCVRVASLAGDVVAYLHWAERRIAWDARAGRRSDTGTVAGIFRAAHPDCADLPVQRRTGVLLVPDDATLESPALFCAYTGLLAVGCGEEAERLRQAHDPLTWNIARKVTDAMGVTQTPMEPPWKAAFEAARTPSRTTCILE